jgi:hypothetical protein
MWEIKNVERYELINKLFEENQNQNIHIFIVERKPEMKIQKESKRIKIQSYFSITNKWILSFFIVVITS